VLALVAAGLLVACGSDDSADDAAPAVETVETVGSADDLPADGATAGAVVVPPEEAAATIEAAPDGLVILDVRTPEEYAEARIEGATLLDFYRPDFAERLAELDRDVPYVLYCRSGNRSDQAFAMMRDLGFTSVQDVDGGIVAWMDAGLPVVSG
jgi:rhodanese-related sulfurtransferase